MTYNYRRCTLIEGPEFGPSLTEPAQGYRMAEAVRRSQAGAPLNAKNPIFLPESDDINPSSRLEYDIIDAYNDKLAAQEKINTYKKEVSSIKADFISASKKARKKQQSTEPSKPPST